MVAATATATAATIRLIVRQRIAGDPYRNRSEMHIQPSWYVDYDYAAYWIRVKFMYALCRYKVTILFCFSYSSDIMCWLFCWLYHSYSYFIVFIWYKGMWASVCMEWRWLYLSLHEKRMKRSTARTLGVSIPPLFPSALLFLWLYRRAFANQFVIQPAQFHKMFPKRGGFFVTYVLRAIRFFLLSCSVYVCV